MQEILSISAEEASIHLKPPLLIVLYPLYYLVIELSSRENDRANSWRSYPPTNSEQKIPYISAKEASMDLKLSLTIALLPNYYLVKERRNSFES